MSLAWDGHHGREDDTDTAVLKTPEQWMDLKHPDMQIWDPDGWRGPNGRSFEDPISEDEFDRRYIMCTLMSRRRGLP